LRIRNDLLFGFLQGSRVVCKRRDHDVADPEYVTNPKIPECRLGGLGLGLVGDGFGRNAGLLNVLRAGRMNRLRQHAS
jgi:hypothetical protein